MSKKLLYTPRSQVKSALRQLFLRSRERKEALKREKYTCQRCNTKQSRAKGKEVKIEVHHIKGIDWDTLIDLVYKHLLCAPSDLEILCVECHKKETEKGND